MWWMKNESATYWVVFVATFFAIAIWESFRPKRPLTWPADRRWGRHALLLAISTAALLLIFRVSPIAIAAAAANNRFGLLNQRWLPFLVKCAATLLLLDLAHYATHRTFHSVHFLWRVHEVHHSDPDFDVSTAARFHPIESLLTQVAYLALIALLAPPPVAVFGAELLSVAVNFFVHANASLPDWAEKMLRRVVFTPTLHRIHHSEEIREQSGNFGTIFPWWDRLFGTYLANSAAGDKGLITGIKGLQNETSTGLGFILAEPFQHRPQAQRDPAS
jgi:sterol desaturase/sphingolipid hydroxylase (fatty acid hydroxylase superfamily)